MWRQAMFYNAKNCSIEIDNTTMDYVTFGHGEKNLIIIPGLGDALKSVKGMAFALSFMYRIFAKDYKVYIFSRKNRIPETYQIKDMARDMATVLNKLGITKTYVLGVSQGGAISQYLAIDYPEIVEKLVLAVTLCRPNDTSKAVLTKWINLAKANDFKSIFIDTAEKTYTEKKLKSLRFFYPLLSKISKPKSLDRFITQANSCLNHNCYDEICKIKCSTFVVGGDDDKIVGNFSSNEIAELIPNSQLKIYHGLGHSAYEEAKDFNKIVLDFFNS